MATPAAERTSAGIVEPGSGIGRDTAVRPRLLLLVLVESALGGGMASGAVGPGLDIGAGPCGCGDAAVLAHEPTLLGDARQRAIPRAGMRDEIALDVGDPGSVQVGILAEMSGKAGHNLAPTRGRQQAGLEGHVTFAAFLTGRVVRHGPEPVTSFGAGGHG